MATTCEYNIICLLEKFLDSLFNSLDDRINIEGYNLLRIDYPDSNKRGGVCVFFNTFQFQEVTFCVI